MQRKKKGGRGKLKIRNKEKMESEERKLGEQFVCKDLGRKTKWKEHLE